MTSLGHSAMPPIQKSIRLLVLLRVSETNIS